MSSGPPSYSADCPYGPARPKCRHGTLEIEHLNNKKSAKLQIIETTHRRLACTMQPPQYPPNRPYRPARPKRRCGTLKIEPLNDRNVSKVERIEMAHLEHASTAQPHGEALNQVHGAYRPSHRCGRLKITPRNVSQTLENETAYLGCNLIVQPHGSPPKWSCRVFGPRC